MKKSSGYVESYILVFLNNKYFKYFFTNETGSISWANFFRIPYEISYFEISHLIEDNSQLVVKYNHKVATIENPKEIMLIAKVVAIWTFQDEKIINGYLISKPS